MASISGTKWHDLNTNGVQDLSEPGLEGWAVHAYTHDPQSGPIALSTVTDANGNYTFVNLVPGDYTIIEESQSGWQQTFPAKQTAAPNILIPVADRRDLVFDPFRDLLYITTRDGAVERYDVSAQALLPPLNVGYSLYGADIAMDGSALYVADGQTTATQGFIRKVNLADDAVTSLAYDLARSGDPDLGIVIEGGAWDIGITANGIGMVTTLAATASQSLPVRELNLNTNVFTIRSDLLDSGFDDVYSTFGQGTTIYRGSDRNLVLMTEVGFSAFIYDAQTDSFPSTASIGSLNQARSAVNRNSSLIAIENETGGPGAGISVFDTNLNFVTTVATVDGGLVFDPNRDILYAADSIADQLVAFETNGWQELYRIEIGEDIEPSRTWWIGKELLDGVMAISDDSQFLFLSTPSGVRMLDLPHPGIHFVDLAPDQTVDNINFGNKKLIGGHFTFEQGLRSTGILSFGVDIPIAQYPLPLGPVERNRLPMHRIFDETYYLSHHPDVAQALQWGALTSGYEHFNAFGWLEGRDPSMLFSEAFYLAQNPDVAAAVQARQLQSGFEHFVAFGNEELRDPSEWFDQDDYLLRYGDINQAVQSHALSSGFEHWLRYGGNEGREPQVMLYQEAFYLDRFPDVAIAVQNHFFTDGFDHYVRYGQREGRDPSPIFDESRYLDAYTDVAWAVGAGYLKSGLQHYIQLGRAEGRMAFSH